MEIRKAMDGTLGTVGSDLGIRRLEVGDRGSFGGVKQGKLHKEREGNANKERLRSLVTLFKSLSNRIGCFKDGAMRRSLLPGANKRAPKPLFWCEATLFMSG